jgi:acyl carrier protein
MTARDAGLDAIRALVERVVGPDRIPPDSGPETPLSGAGFWLDSVELLEVVVACEAEFEITFDATRDLTGAALETLGALTELLRSKQSRVRAYP